MITSIRESVYGNKSLDGWSMIRTVRDSTRCPGHPRPEHDNIHSREHPVRNDDIIIMMMTMPSDAQKHQPCYADVILLLKPL